MFGKYIITKADIYSACFSSCPDLNFIFPLNVPISSINKYAHLPSQYSQISKNLLLFISSQRSNSVTKREIEERNRKSKLHHPKSHHKVFQIYLYSSRSITTLCKESVNVNIILLV